jgi:hypothetical protein
MVTLEARSSKDYPHRHPSLKEYTKVPVNVYQKYLLLSLAFGNKSITINDSKFKNVPCLLFVMLQHLW